MSVIDKYLKETEHHELGCSKYPMWKHCGGYDSADIDPADLNHPANRGTLQHAYLEQLVNGDIDAELVKALSDHEKAACDHTYNTWVKPAITGGEYMTERRFNFLDKEFNLVYFSKVDLAWIDEFNRLNIADYKTGQQRNYHEQLAGYALAVMQALGKNSCNVYTVYTESDYVDEFKFTYETALDIVNDVLANRESGILKKCQYCSWCKHVTDCPEITGDVVKIAEGYSDGALTLDSWHPSELTDPEQMFQALKVASILESWIKSVKYHANEMVLKNGTPIPNTKIKKRSGKQTITDMLKAYEACGFSPEDFISACSISIPKLADVESKVTGLSKAKARKSIEDKLGDLIKIGSESSWVELEKK